MFRCSSTPKLLFIISNMNRKEFVRNTALATAAIALPGKSLFAFNGAANKVQVAIIGVGLRGQNHLELLLRRNDVDVVAICDISDVMLAAAKEMITKSGKKMPQVFTGDVYA